MRDKPWRFDGGIVRVVSTKQGTFAVFSVVALAAFGTVAALSSGSGPLATILNAGLPVLILFCCSSLAIAAARDRDFIWSPRVWFLFACAAYYGFGQLIYIFGADDSIAFLDRYYFVDSAKLLKTNSLNGISLAIVIGTSSIMVYLLGTSDNASPDLDATRISKVTYVLLAVGAPATLLGTLPTSLGAVDGPTTGVVPALAQFSLAAVCPLLLLVKMGKRAFVPLLLGLIAFELIAAFASFSKLAILKVLLFCGLTYYWLYGGVRKILFAGVVIAVFYLAILSDLILFLRLEFGLDSVRSFWSFLTGTSSYTSGASIEIDDLLPGVQSWWTRLAPAPPQAYAMDAYDSGNGDETLWLSLYAWMPRFIFPDKPVLTVGEYFNILVTGTATSKSAPGLFAEGYWNWGWFGAALVSVYVGVVIAVLERYCVRLARRKDLLFLPCIWLAISMALQPDSWFAAQFVGPLLILAAFHLAFAVVVGPGLRLRPRSSAQAV